MRLMLRPVIMAAGLLLLSACGASADPDTLLAHAREAYAAESDQAARIDLLQLLKQRPDDPVALALLAQVQVRLGDGEGAIATLDKLGPQATGTPDMVRLRAEAELLRGQPERAVALLARDQSPAAWRIRAGAALAREDQPGALSAYAAGAAAGYDMRLLIAYARLLMDGEDWPAAERLLAQLKQRDAKALSVQLLEGDLLAAQDRQDEARRVFAAAAQQAPTRVEPLLGQAALADAAGRDDEVERLVKAAEAIAPDDVRVREWVVQVAQLKGDWATVRDRLAPYEASLDPRSADGLAYAEALLNLGQPEQARALFRRALAASPQNPYSRLMLAEAQLATGDARTALETVRPLAKAVAAGERELDLAERAARAAGSPEAAAFAQRRSGLAETQRLMRQGEDAAARGQWPAAVAAYTALTARGEDAEVLRRLAIAASRAGQHDLAIASADRAMTLDETNPDMQFAAGVVRLDAGRDAPRGLALIEAALVADPKNTVFRARLARAKAAGLRPEG